MKRLLLIGIWLIFASTTCVNETQTVFGVKVGYQATGQFITFIAYLDNGGYKSAKKILTENEFVHVASGKWPSIYNPKRENFLEKHGLDCGIVVDSFSRKESSYCFPADSLWRIRFNKHPFDLKAGNGWSNKPFKPSSAQEIFLFEHYGIKQIDCDYFEGKYFWQILEDVQNPEWIANYKMLQ